IKGNDGKYTEESVNEVFSKIGGIAKNKHTAITKPYISDVRRITNYANTYNKSKPKSRGFGVFKKAKMAEMNTSNSGFEKVIE
ncbi:MAG: hypothetical protein IJ272_00990, partial [Clostridia bacterium]|nr:hypothetical protein [Clostridia bacterium]